MILRDKTILWAGLWAAAVICAGCDESVDEDAGTRDAGGSDTGLDAAAIGDAAAPDAAARDAALPDAAGRDATVPDDAALPVPDSCEGGSVVYAAGGELLRSRLGSTVTTESISAGLDALAPGADEWAAVSPDGASLLISSDRFASECAGWACIAVVAGDLSSFETVRIAGEVVHAERASAIASGGERIIFSDDAGAGIGLYAINRVGGGWSAPLLLTADSPSTYNIRPAISDDGARVVFDCGEDVYSQPPTGICEVNTDGTGFRVVWTPEQGGVGAPGRADAALHHPDYLPDGSIVFEADWTGEQLWRIVGDSMPARITDEFGNDNSPCALATGCIISLWLERPGGAGDHEMKIMDASGGNVSMVRTGIDISDTGITCGL